MPIPVISETVSDLRLQHFQIMNKDTPSCIIEKPKKKTYRQMDPTPVSDLVNARNFNINGCEEKCLYM